MQQINSESGSIKYETYVPGSLNFYGLDYV